MLVIALLVTPLKADTTATIDDFQWCDSIAFDENHVMYQDLEAHRKVLMDTPIHKQIIQRQEFYQLLLNKYNSIYSDSEDFDDERVQVTIRALKLYISHLPINGEKPTVWNAINKFQVNELWLTGIGPYVGLNKPLRISCAAFEVSDSDETKDAKSAVIGVAYLSRYVESLSRVGLKKIQIAAAAEADLLSESYQSWIFNGLAQWPWELKLNEMLMPDNFNEVAPDWQFTLLRPNLGFAIKPNDINDADLDYALMLEPAGFIKYLKDDVKTDYERWWGVSALVSITDSNGTGYGLMARYNNFMLGACIHDSQDQDWLIYLGVDLYKYLLGEDGKVKQYQMLEDRYVPPN